MQRRRFHCRYPTDAEARSKPRPICRACGTLNPADFRFCVECGTVRTRVATPRPRRRADPFAETHPAMAVEFESRSPTLPG